jgi:DNA-binding GntR family transcriptional regulator
MKAYYHISSRMILVRPIEHGPSLREHTAIVEAIIAGNAKLAEKHMRTHTLRNLRVAFPAAVF